MPEKPSRRCQCSNHCKNTPLKDSPFCKNHQTSCPNKAKLSGWEPDYSPQRYNNDKAIQYSHNCYAYSLRYLDNDKIKECREKDECHFHVPGKKGKSHPDFQGKLGKTCSDIATRTLSDIPNGYLTNFDTKCRPGMSKIFMLVDKDRDLHYGSQDSNGYWSHKPGGRKVTDRDSEGTRIYRPDLASWHYPKEDSDEGLSYKFCSYMCVPRDGSIRIVGGTSRRARRARRARRTRKSL